MSDAPANLAYKRTLIEEMMMLSILTSPPVVVILLFIASFAVLNFLSSGSVD
ncbi:MAG: hypothetical protein MRY72_08165 [Aquisalinus sp.]|nr:hypothetical protein [Aquisalinus sp.]